MKASALHQSMKDYLIGLLAKDAVENPPKYLDNKSFKKELKHILQDDAELMQKLSDRFYLYLFLKAFFLFLN